MENRNFTGLDDFVLVLYGTALEGHPVHITPSASVRAVKRASSEFGQTNSR